MFGLFAGAPGVGGRQERRRQFALGPSQIANLPGNFPMPRACAPRLVLALAEQRESPVAPRHAAEAELGARKLARRALRARAAHHLLQQHVAPARRRRPGVPAVLPPAPTGGSRVAPAPLRPRGARRGIVRGSARR